MTPSPDARPLRTRERCRPKTLVEGSRTPISIGAIAGGRVGGNPGVLLRNGAEARVPDFLSGVGKSNVDGDGSAGSANEPC